MKGKETKGQLNIQDPIIEEMGHFEGETDKISRDIDQIIMENKKLMKLIREKREKIEKLFEKER